MDLSGDVQGEPIVSKDVVSGDIARIGPKLCWPYMNMTWDSDENPGSIAYGPNGAWADQWDPYTPIKMLKMSIACIATDGSSAGSPGATSSSALKDAVTASLSSAATLTQTVSIEQLPGPTEQAATVATVSLSQFASGSYVDAVPTAFVTVTRTASATVESCTQG